MHGEQQHLDKLELPNIASLDGEHSMIAKLFVKVRSRLLTSNNPWVEAKTVLVENTGETYTGCAVRDGVRRDEAMVTPLHSTTMQSSLRSCASGMSSAFTIVISNTSVLYTVSLLASITSADSLTCSTSFFGLKQSDFLLEQSDFLLKHLD
jgi:hypothetical protein